MKPIDPQTSEHEEVGPLNFPVIKPEWDKRKFANFIMSNGIEVFIANEATNAGTISLSVAVGAKHDPIEFPGMAHFVQRMLTCGSRKYPGIETHRKFYSDKTNKLASASGVTTRDYTALAVQVTNQQVKSSFDRLMRCVTEPLFPEEAVEGELDAIEEIFQSKIEDESEIIIQMERILLSGKINYPLIYGNKRTLSHGNLLPCAKRFYQQYYIPSRMKIVALVTQKPEMIEKWVLATFGTIVDPFLTNNPPVSSIIPSCAFSAPPLAFKPPYCGTLVKMKSNPAFASLLISFPIPDQRLLYETNPCSYFAYILESQCNNSFQSRLRSANLIVDIACFNKHRLDGLDLFQVKLRLTEKGEKLWDEVLSYFYDYLDIMTSAYPEAAIYEGMTKDYVSKFNNVDYTALEEASIYQEALQLPIPRDRVLDFMIPRHFEPGQIQHLGGFLRFGNSNVMFMSRHLHGLTEFDPLYGIQYSTEHIAQSSHVGCMKQ